MKYKLELAETKQDDDNNIDLCWKYICVPKKPILECESEEQKFLRGFIQLKEQLHKKLSQIIVKQQYQQKSMILCFSEIKTASEFEKIARANNLAFVSYQYSLDEADNSFKLKLNSTDKLHEKQCMHLKQLLISHCHLDPDSIDLMFAIAGPSQALIEARQELSASFAEQLTVINNLLSKLFAQAEKFDAGQTCSNYANYTLGKMCLKRAFSEASQSAFQEVDSRAVEYPLAQRKLNRNSTSTK